MKERHISQRKEGKRQNKKKVVEEEKEEEEKVGTRIRRGLKASRRIKNSAKMFLKFLLMRYHLYLFRNQPNENGYRAI